MSRKEPTKKQLGKKKQKKKNKKKKTDRKVRNVGGQLRGWSLGCSGRTSFQEGRDEHCCQMLPRRQKMN